MQLFEKISILRKKEGLSQEDLANKLDVSRQTVYKWESDLATPEIEKLKAIAKLFNVSFDYLLNDNIETEDRTTKKIKMATREPYVLGEVVDPNHANIDHGYAEKCNALIVDSEIYFNDNVAKMEDTLNNLGATEIVQLMPNTSIAFFYNSKNRTFGFYYNGKIQIACPIENYIDFYYDDENSEILNTNYNIAAMSLNGGMGFGSMPSQVAIATNSTTVTLKYYKENKIHTLEMYLNLGSGAYITKEEAKDIDQYELFKRVNMSYIMKKLKEVKTHLNAYSKKSKEIIRGNITVEEFVPEEIEDLNIELTVEYNQYLNLIEKEASSANRRKLITIGFGIILVAAAVVGLFAALKSIL